jgi:hypothetical protein
MNLDEEVLEKIAGGELEYYKKYTSKYPVTRQEAHKIRMTAKKCRSSGMSYGDYLRHMRGVVKPRIDGDRRTKYADRIFYGGDPDAGRSNHGAILQSRTAAAGNVHPAEHLDRL